MKSKHAIQQGCLAASVWTDQAEDFTFFNAETDPAEDLFCSIRK